MRVGNHQPLEPSSLVFGGRSLANSYTVHRSATWQSRPDGRRGRGYPCHPYVPDLEGIADYDEKYAKARLSPLFLSVNAGKRSITLDLKHEKAAGLAHLLEDPRFAETAGRVKWWFPPRAGTPTRTVRKRTGLRRPSASTPTRCSAALGFSETEVAGLRHTDAFPAADLGLLRAAVDRDGRRPTPRELEVMAEPWRPLRGYAAMCLWQSSASASGG